MATKLNPCPECDGTGKIEGDGCLDCYETGSADCPGCGEPHDACECALTSRSGVVTYGADDLTD